jgi:hypothetical protein
MGNCENYPIYGTLWQQWQCHRSDGEISDVENDFGLFIWGSVTGQFQLYVFSYGTKMPKIVVFMDIWGMP